MRKETNSFHILNTCSLEIELGRNVDLLADVFAVLFPLAYALGQKILDLAVDGAVGMVEMALERLAEKGTVELDEERKAAMVSNLLVVLCGNHDAQPVVNSGSLY